MGGSESAAPPSASTNNTTYSCEGDVSKLTPEQQLQCELSDCKSTRDAYAIENNTLKSDKATLERDKATLERDKATLERDKATLKNTNNTLFNAIDVFTELEEAAIAFSNAFTQFRSKKEKITIPARDETQQQGDTNDSKQKETFASSSPCTSICVIIAVILVGVAIALFFSCQKKPPVYEKIDTEPIIVTTEQ